MYLLKKSLSFLRWTHFRFARLPVDHPSLGRSGTYHVSKIISANLLEVPRCDNVISGECERATQIGQRIRSNNVKECIDQCQETPSCKWYTHDGSRNSCSLHSACNDPTIQFCPKCTSGVPALCDEETFTTPDIWILVATGLPTR